MMTLSDFLDKQVWRMEEIRGSLDNVKGLLGEEENKHLRRAVYKMEAAMSHTTQAQAIIQEKEAGRNANDDPIE